MNSICSYCGNKNERDNFLCSDCGFYLDMEITFNELNLLEIKPKNK